MTPDDILRQLEGHSSQKLKLTINDNRSTMLSVKWEPDCTKVSLHRMFLNAPQNVMDSLACYIDKRQKSVAHPIKAFISEKRQSLDYSNCKIIQKIDHQGDVYHLGQLYDRLNEEYFEKSLGLKITWFGKRFQNNKSQVTFGLYFDSLKLIKVSRLLDRVETPEYVISFIIYHEMLHYACPAYTDEKGFNRIHNPQFKKRESAYKEFAQANDWLQQHRKLLFT